MDPTFTHLVYLDEELVGVAYDVEEVADHLFGTVISLGTGEMTYTDLHGYQLVAVDAAARAELEDARTFLDWT